ncbi:dTDP-4-dehydrorhamnose reductase family protein [Escherichia albertii]|uniref:dTDP-4-dehydrorhamnose reductase n=1 Tax=Escherichia albertii TaxID=208962 RepID=A0A1Z1EDR9_ESCAL|nr:SDR family oxidoreductase [Escherichia albertii]CTW27524.1 dTDP-4-dehydrorhamnose reductase [Escherichia coli]ARO72623.1 dTDP-4-dehydrorhamnose reductase [Escherichia albertii]ARO72723.1 dTDP-4-dehydrorhamnose reductase [Escherichia albertii]ARO72870.1 dTDP-4-dehydrorhamnose reductase [Escherichia albertii]ARO72920.1 dTDP-4-dehydrorhamnose reductase [Escherichia albertii]
MRILILGASGMLGYSLYANLSDYSAFEVFGTVRDVTGREHFYTRPKGKIIQNVDILDLTKLERIIAKLKPDIVINCVGLIKQLSISKQYTSAIKINALLPHELAEICCSHGAKLIHFSTDCVFDGKKGNYKEDDFPTAIDLYGRAKHMGEVCYGGHITLRTSIIGHELVSSVSLVDWFLSQKQEVKGFSKAIFSGVPTAYIAKLLAEKIIPNTSLRGLYHLSAFPINKYDLLTKISKAYNKDIIIHESDELIIDRSLNSEFLREKIEFIPPNWDELINYMNSDYEKWYKLCK